MLKKLLSFVWRNVPVGFRRWGVRLTQEKFTVTAGAVVVDEHGRVLLLKHVFRTGSGWGIPGGFIEKGEQPEEAVRRELHEEAGLELESAEIAFARTLARPRQIEIIFRCRPRGEASAQSLEIKGIQWFALDALPSELTSDQRRLIERALKDGAKPPH